MLERRGTGAGDRCRALLVEADEAYGVAIAACVRLAGCNVTTVTSPDRAFGELDRQRFDLVVWGVSPGHAPRRREVIAEVRLRTDAPLVMVEGGSDMAQFGLEMGADQWVPKPFVPGALVGSVRAALRKASTPVVLVASRVEIRGIVLDGRRRGLTYAGREIVFTRQEWDLLSILVSHPDRFLSAREILRLGWRAGDHGPEQLRTYVHRLRQKFQPLNLPCRLDSQHGHGYCLTFEREARRSAGRRGTPAEAESPER
jgi:DNA-binding response OmpR family regulator